ncbi:MAG TPA: hypothetical protein VE732_02025 [Nitrososphaera sp.]|jgi:hypothetical protein|nr:hypothetical protein [Nitrososphaera sp.]
MAKESDTLNNEKEQRQVDQSLRREDALKALRRLRDIGEKLPTVDAAAVIREGRVLAEQGSR